MRSSATRLDIDQPQRDFSCSNRSISIVINAGVSFEDRQDLLGHKSTRITTHHSAAELANLMAASEKALEEFDTKFPQTTGSPPRQIPKLSFNIKELTQLEQNLAEGGRFQ